MSGGGDGEGDGVCGGVFGCGGGKVLVMRYWWW